MSRDKQIDEMAKIIVRENCMKEPCVNCNYGDYVIGEIDCIEYLIAENLYNAGYRKASDVAEEIADFIWDKDIPDTLLPINGRYLSKQDFIAELKKKYESEGE